MEVSSGICKHGEKPEHKGTSPALRQVSWIRPGSQPPAQQGQQLEAEKPLRSRGTTVYVLGPTRRAVKHQRSQLARESQGEPDSALPISHGDSTTEQLENYCLSKA